MWDKVRSRSTSVACRSKALRPSCARRAGLCLCGGPGKRRGRGGGLTAACSLPSAALGEQAEGQTQEQRRAGRKAVQQVEQTLWVRGKRDEELGQCFPLAAGEAGLHPVKWLRRKTSTIALAVSSLCSFLLPVFIAEHCIRWSGMSLGAAGVGCPAVTLPAAPVPAARSLRGRSRAEGKP